MHRPEIQLLNWTHIPTRGLAWTGGLSDNKAWGFQGIQKRGCLVLHNGKHPWIREGSEALRQLILLLVVGSLVCERTLLRILLLGISVSSTVVSSLVNR